MAIRSEMNCLLLIWDGIRDVSKISCVFEATLKWNSKTIQPVGHVCMTIWSEMNCFLPIWYGIRNVTKIACAFNFQDYSAGCQWAYLHGPQEWDSSELLSADMILWHQKCQQDPQCVWNNFGMKFQDYSAGCACLHGPQEWDEVLSADIVLL